MQPPSRPSTSRPRRQRHAAAEEFNLIPLPYRAVSVQNYDGPMTREGLISHFMGRETYRRTEFIVLRAQDERYAVITVDAQDREPLFSPITHVEVLALPDSCVYVRDPQTDCGNRSALAALATTARRWRTGNADLRRTIRSRQFHLIVLVPFLLKVVEVAPPEPPKLFDLVSRVLDYADLPPIVPILERIELNELVRGVSAPAFLVPCRSGGLDDLGAPVHYLDERPAERARLDLDRLRAQPPIPSPLLRRRAAARRNVSRAFSLEQRNEPTILKCCLWEFDIERQGDVMVVPWGADLAMVERALRELFAIAEAEPPHDRIRIQIALGRRVVARRDHQTSDPPTAVDRRHNGHRHGRRPVEPA